MKKSKVLSAIMISGIFLTCAAQADYSPGSEIKVLQGFKAGGGSDALAQLTQPFLRESLGVEIVNEYLPGASGAIAWTRLSHMSPSDGTVLSITSSPVLMTNYIMNDHINYTIDDMTPIANVVTDPAIIVVPENSQFKTIEEFFTAAREKPGSLTVGNSGVGGDDFFATIMIEEAAGVSFQKVPFQGDGPSATAAMGEKIHASVNNVGNVYGHVQAGNLRALAVLSSERLELLPDVPTLREKGVDIVTGSSRGYSAPKDIPEKARNELIAAFEEMRGDERVQQEARKRALSLDIVTGDEYFESMQNMQARYKEIWENFEE